MDDNNKVSAAISVDIKKSRIRIYRTTLTQLGLPKYIQLLVNPNDRMIAVRGLDKRCRESHIVSFSHMRTDYSYELYSKELITTLMSLLQDLDGNCTYKLTGEVYSDSKVALFSLDTIQKFEGGVLGGSNGIKDRS